MNMNRLEKTITFEEVKHRLENKKLEDYSRQDVFERYIVYQWGRFSLTVLIFLYFVHKSYNIL